MSLLNLLSSPAMVSDFSNFVNKRFFKSDLCRAYFPLQGPVHFCTDHIMSDILGNLFFFSMFKTDKHGKKDCTYAMKRLVCIETRTGNSYIDYCEYSDKSEFILSQTLY